MMVLVPQVRTWLEVHIYNTSRNEKGPDSSTNFRPVHCLFLVIYEYAGSDYILLSHRGNTLLFEHLCRGLNRS
jgi:hypothetical protein